MLKIDVAFGHVRRLVVSVRGIAVTELILCCFKGIFKSISKNKLTIQIAVIAFLVLKLVVDQKQTKGKRACKESMSLLDYFTFIGCVKCQYNGITIISINYTLNWGDILITGTL